MQIFHRQDFQYLYENCFSEHDRGRDGFARLLQITDAGVFYDSGIPVELLRWKFGHELAGPNKPPSAGPALPFPFTASQLAAFMLWGWGNYFQDAFGRLDCGPNEFVLNGEHEDAADAYEALRQAYVIYRKALHVVGELDNGEQQRAHELLGKSADAFDQALEREKVMERVVIGKNKDGSPIYGDFIAIDERLARAKEAVAAQKAQALQAKAEADAALKTWRRAMVRQLLQPEVDGVEQTPDPERRFALLRALGGSAKYSRGEWRFTGTVALVAREKADGRIRSDGKTIRADLKEAAQAESDAKTAGVFNGLGQR
jgi:hypothetical protein